MNSKVTITTYERSCFCIEGEVVKDEIPLPEKSFDNLWNSILVEQGNKNTEKAFNIATRKGKRIIRVQQYVGTIQTKDGLTIEILPKIYKVTGQQDADIKKCRKIFLKMLATNKNAKIFASQDTLLQTKDNFPIFEMLIIRYLEKVRDILKKGIQKDYVSVSENQKYLKGKLNISKHIQKNSVDQTNFFVDYEKYAYDIAPNRIIVSTLHSLKDETSNRIVLDEINQLLSLLADIPQSSNIEKDLTCSRNTNRLFQNYKNIIVWSDQFLHHKSFTNFTGKHLNQSFLFNAERLFEDFVSHLFKKHISNFEVSTQDTSCHLIDDHNAGSMFGIRPDIVLFPITSQKDCLIIDIKWKCIDESRGNKKEHYNIDLKDLYQLFAYGKKYKELLEKITPDIKIHLGIVYPLTDTFIHPLSKFTYDYLGLPNEMCLKVLPFNISDSLNYESQVHDIVNHMLV